MEEQIINLKKLINIQSNKINSLEKRILILENNKKYIPDLLFNRLRNNRKKRFFRNTNSRLNPRLSIWQRP